MPDISRRDFLKLARDGFLYLSGALALGGLLRFLSFQTEPAPQTEFDLGLAADYPLNSRTLLSNIPAVLLHTENGFSAMSLICTHLGCTVEQKQMASPAHVMARVMMSTEMSYKVLQLNLCNPCAWK